jgi:FixJ family two-component response regulator
LLKKDWLLGAGSGYLDHRRRRVRTRVDQQADVQMPGMTGLELQTLLQAKGRLLPIVFITAFPDEKVRTRAMDQGAVGFLSKPFESSKLIACINAALKQRSDRPSTP